MNNTDRLIASLGMGRKVATVIDSAYNAGVACGVKEAGAVSAAGKKLMHKLHHPLHTAAHQSAHKKVHHLAVPHEKKADAGARLLGHKAAAPFYAGRGLIEADKPGAGGAVMGVPVGALGGAIAGGLLKRRPGLGAALGALGGGGIGYGLGRALGD